MRLLSAGVTAIARDFISDAALLVNVSSNAFDVLS